MSLPYFPVYIGDYLKDTMHLSAEEHGAYLLLIFACATGGGRVPDNDAALSAIARLGPRRWKVMRPTVAAFFDVRDGFWTHRRVVRELEAAAKKSEKAAQSARTRWGNANAMRTHMRPQSERNADGDANGMLSSSLSEPTTTEPSISTEARPLAPAPAREDGAPAAADDAGGVVQAFDAAGRRHYGPAWRPWPGARDHGTARAMLEAGADPALCAAAFDALLAGMAAKGQPPPRTLSYARGAVADALASQRQVLEPGHVREPSRQDQQPASPRARMLAGFAAAARDLGGADHPDDEPAHAT
jgi:uncharacterized protein YdaU (DUF1376 family)